MKSKLFLIATILILAGCQAKYVKDLIPKAIPVRVKARAVQDMVGTRLVWQPPTFTFIGPTSSQTSNTPNPFLQYRLNVSFTGPTNKTLVVPGYYAGSDKWEVVFTPNEEGVWSSVVSFRQGTNISVSLDPNAGTPIAGNGDVNMFNVFARDPNASGFFGKGKLYNGPYIFTSTNPSELSGNIGSDDVLKTTNSPYVITSDVTVMGDARLTADPGVVVAFKEGVSIKAVGNGAIVFSNSTVLRPATVDESNISGTVVSFFPDFYYRTLGDGKAWIKGGTDSPECFLAVNFSPHGGVYGALSYLSGHHVNSIYVLLMNVGGDGNNVWPWISSTDIWHYDVTKLKTWQSIFAYANSHEILLHLILNEGELANKEVLGKTGLTVQRKLYYREMVARFGYLNAVQWNLSEEYDHHCGGCKLDVNDVRSWADYIDALDPYDHSITIHNWGTEEQALIEPGVVDGWSPFWGEERWGTVSYQYRWERGINPSYNTKVITLRNYADTAGHKLPIGLDEADSFEPFEASVCTKPSWNWSCGYTAARRELIWPIYLGGGNLETYLGGQPNQIGSPTDPYDFSVWETVWDQMWYARKFIESFPFWTMTPNNSLLTNATGYVLTNHDVYAIYLPNGGNGSINLSGTVKNFTLRWYNPRTGQYQGASKVIQGNGIRSLGNTPDSNDWVGELR